MEETKRSKTAGGASGLELTPEDLAGINKHTLRELTAEEVFAFRVTLCDNRVDRDYERFPTAALHKLAELFLGKTGVFDHKPSALGQTARIYHTEVVESTEMDSSISEPFAALVARAYMLRDDSTMATIRSIEAGILKEVSVGCAVGKVTCSVCGADQKATGCTHLKGEVSDNRLCHHLLEEPTDAYEWSFVAVPAQVGAGVTKALIKTAEIDLDDLINAFHEALSQALAKILPLEEPKPPQDDPGQEPAKSNTPPDPAVEALLNNVNKLLEETERRAQK